MTETRHAANWHTPGCDVSRSSQRPGPALSPLQDTCSCSLTSHLSLHQAVTQTWRKTTRSGQRRSITREEKTKEQSFSGRRPIHAVTATWHRRDSHAAVTAMPPTPAHGVFGMSTFHPPWRKIRKIPPANFPRRVMSHSPAVSVLGLHKHLRFRNTNVPDLRNNPPPSPSQA
jgi:hypothetical protein